MSKVLGKRKLKPILEWISATSLYPVIMEDHCSVWLKLTNKKSSSNSQQSSSNSQQSSSNSQQAPQNSFKSFLFSQGNKFEKSILSFLSQNHQVVSLPNFYSEDNVKKTLEAMSQKIPIIHSGSINNPVNNTYGITDLLVRIDYLHKIFPYFPQTIENHYIVIDIKFSTLPLRADGIHILNSDNFKAYKSQLYIYNEALGYHQNYTPTKAYILGRKYKYTSKGKVFEGKSAFDKLGEIDFINIDKHVVDDTNNAVKWLRNINRDMTFQSNPELYPNMKVNPTPEKYELAHSLKDITLLWYCGLKERELAFSKGYKTWDTVSADILGIKGKRGEIIDKIIEVNKGPDLILPYKLVKTQNLLKKMNKEIFVDFETIGGMFDDFCKVPYINTQNYIFMISIGWFEDGFQTKTFTMKTLCREEELRIITEFKQFIGEDSEIYHYSDAEPSTWKTAIKKHNVESRLSLEGRWTDLLYIFREEPITIKGCFDFSLKSFGNAMIKHKLIEGIEWEDITGGMDAMLKAWISYTTNVSYLKEIEKYNQIDCYMLFKILEFIRKNMM